MQLEITGVSPAYHQLCQGHTGMIRLATRAGPGGARGDSESEFAGHGISYPIIGQCDSQPGGGWPRLLVLLAVQVEIASETFYIRQPLRRLSL